MACSFASVHTEKSEISYKADFVWHISPFKEELPKNSKFNAANFKSPDLETWWYDVICISLDVEYRDLPNSGYAHVGKFNIILDHSENGCILEGVHYFRILFKPHGASEQKDVLYSGSEFSSDIISQAKIVWGNYDALKLYIEIEFASQEIGFHYSPAAIAFRKNAAALKENEHLSDVSLCVNGNTVNANKILLATISPVFKAMFDHNFRENKDNTVHIKDTDFDTVQEFVKFSYMCENPSFENIESARRLFNMANKYQVEILKSICLKYIVSTIKADTTVVEDLLKY